MRKIITSNKGFSLIELMVVVAIIGVLSAIGIPQYTKFQARARQSEAKSHLSALFTAETSFQSEWNVFTTDLRNAGVAATGSNLRYTAGFPASGCGAAYATMAPGAPAEVAANIQIHMPAVTAATAATWNVNLGFGAVAQPLAGGACANAVGGSTFTAVSRGDPRNSIAAPIATDTWTINQMKLVSNTVNGL